MTGDERLARLEERFNELRNDVTDLTRYVMGPPREESLRGRLYNVEGDRIAAKAATAALEAARAINGQRLSRKQQVLIGLTSAVVALCAITTTTVVLFQAVTG